MNTDKLFSIKTKEDFISFLNELSNDKTAKDDKWENKSLEDYLDSIARWVEDMDGYYHNTNRTIPENINWQFIAELLYVGKIYE